MTTASLVDKIRQRRPDVDHLRATLIAEIVEEDRDYIMVLDRAYRDKKHKPEGGFSPQPGGPNWTLHALEYVVEIIAGQRDGPYLRARGKAQGQVAVRGSTVLLFDDSIYIKVGQVFESESPEKCAWRAAEYVEVLLRVLERDLGLVLLKDRVQNIKRVKGEFSHMNDCLALQPGAANLRVYSADDGKPRVVVDWSPGTMPGRLAPRRMLP